MRFTIMEFSRHPNARTERLNQIAVILSDLYPSLREDLPPFMVEKLKQLEDAEFRLQHGEDG